MVFYEGDVVIGGGTVEAASEVGGGTVPGGVTSGAQL
jgi:hypothetical protein